MKPEVRKYQSENEYYFQEGCFITELSNTDNDNDVSIAKARVQPGVKTRKHALSNITERYVILSGQGIVEVEGQPTEVVATNDCVIIPPGKTQSILNNGQEDLIFLAICSPRFELSSYQDRE